MKNRNTLAQVGSASLFALLSLALINPFGLWMPSMAHETILALLVIAFGIFLAFLLKERAGDERDDAHRALAGRAAFLIGCAVLLAGVLAQSMSGMFDAWLVGALAAMVLAKVAARLWSERVR
jgi:hypothetical protein